MKKIYILPIAASIVIGALSFQNSSDFKIEKYLAKNGHKFAAGAPTGRTGAPGEGNCTGCHSGTAQSGVGENMFILLNGATPVTSYTPGTVYTASLTLSSNPAKKGFQAIVLDGTDVMAGTFTGVAGNTAITINGTKEYANHTSTSNTDAISTWGWSWTAPLTDAGNVTFYIAANKANNNGTNSGDVIYLSQHIITSTAGIVEQTKEEALFTAGYSVDNNSIVIDFTTLSIGEMTLNVVDLNGRSVFFNNLGNSSVGQNKQTVALPADIKNGMYIVNFFLNNKAMSAKILVQK